ncbi:hypothetical protein IFM89_036259 [Coptis chinensis]|uniref:Cytokinin riboside 5'-monophosphate phosphoribohydrolase n=1 Tax=Coptis chinensis TaxID=261450 RepID=A0A835LPV3_9MAGN|nr:hypothetical protein IFM89_036259 [Coptis chinensis]
MEGLGDVHVPSEKKSRFERICVFCGSRAGYKSTFSDAALELGKQLISGTTIGETKTVADMHERKSEMAKYANAFIALPGGYGTMEELLEMITWAQLGIHEKPVGLLNVDGYYNSLLALFDKGVEEGFIEDSARQIVVSANTPAELIQKMEEYAPVHQKVAPSQSWEVDQLLESSSSGNPR